jgi:hypothetical protein
MIKAPEKRSALRRPCGSGRNRDGLMSKHLEQRDQFIEEALG